MTPPTTYHVTRLIRDHRGNAIPAVLWPIVVDEVDLGFFVAAALKTSFENREGGVEVRNVRTHG